MKRYNNLNFLRALAAAGILMMHVSLNLGYSVAGYGIIDNLVQYFAKFVRLFFIISGFSMCCGYYEKIRTGAISPEKFYSKRYLRILPFFALLVAVDLCVAFLGSGTVPQSSFVEAFFNLTMTTGLLSAGEFTVIGVGWTLGVIFAFYIIFPFFVFLIGTRRRAWITLAVTLVMNWLCIVFFHYGSMKCNVLMWLCYFVAGGLLYLYREEIGGMVKHPLIGLGMMVLGFCLMFLVHPPQQGLFWVLVQALQALVAFCLMVAGAMGPDSGLFTNPVTDLLSRVSLEVYLSHMMVVRFLEKLGLLQPFGQNIASWAAVSLMTLAGAVLFALAYQWAEKRIENLLKKR